jgi:hypothetical protein
MGSPPAHTAEPFAPGRSGLTPVQICVATDCACPIEWAHPCAHLHRDGVGSPVRTSAWMNGLTPPTSAARNGVRILRVFCPSASAAHDPSMLVRTRACTHTHAHALTHSHQHTRTQTNTSTRAQPRALHATPSRPCCAVQRHARGAASARRREPARRVPPDGHLRPAAHVRRRDRALWRRLPVGAGERARRRREQPRRRQRRRRGVGDERSDVLGAAAPAVRPPLSARGRPRARLLVCAVPGVRGCVGRLISVCVCVFAVWACVAHARTHVRTNARKHERTHAHTRSSGETINGNTLSGIDERRMLLWVLIIRMRGAANIPWFIQLCSVAVLVSSGDKAASCSGLVASFRS